MSLVYNNREQHTEYFETNLPASIQERRGIVQRVMSQEPAQINLQADSPITSENFIQRMGEVMDAIQETQSHIGELVSETIPLAIEAPVVKQRAPRKVKEKPAFWKETIAGGITEFPIRLGKRLNSFDDICSGNYYIDSQLHLTSPNVKMIPLKYLLNSGFILMHDFRYIDHNINRCVVDRDQEAARNIVAMKTGISDMLSGLLAGGRIERLNHSNFKSVLSATINNYMCVDTLLEMCVNSQGEWGVFEDAPRFFQTSGRIDARTFSVNLGGLSCFMADSRNSSNFIPQVMAVVLPENYIYQKEYLLTHGKVDLSKVILLVNKELDSPSFYQKNFRAFYRKYILPIIKTLNIDVWNVPVSFMEEYCFHNKITLESKSFMDKKKETEGLYDEFKNRYIQEDEPDEEIEDDDDYDEVRG